MEGHRRVVARVAGTVKDYFTRKEPFRISHGSTNSTRPDVKKRVVDISELRNVLKVDTKSQTALVEPNVPMDRLVEATLPHGLVPPVVMEFPGITVGGGYAGTAGESSSFKFGFFDRTINSVEMVLADGQVVTASDQQNADLFRGAAGAVGTLGVTTLVELQLIKAQKYVKTTYHPTTSVGAAVREARAQTEEEANHYVDGILFSKDHGAIITGEMVDELPSGVKPQTFSNPWDPWFYLHVEARTRNASTPIVDYIPLAEYMFRYDRGGFWVGRSAFTWMKFPFNKFTRWFLDDFCHTRMLYRALHASGEATRYVVQDMALPYPNAEKFIDYTDKTFGIWPLWLCPLKQSPQPTMHPHTKGKLADDQMLNIGLWGFGPANRDEFLDKNRQLEKKLGEFGGMKWLYAHTYYTKGEFWSQFDREWHEKLRTKYRAETFPDVYEKVHVDIAKHKELVKNNWLLRIRDIWPLGGFWGIWKSIQSKDYKIHRASTWRTR
ncbi:24-dehydrocholesterol reductase-like protein precursor [Aaosphaeria arxii CBS 175.79]|uniref:Delta(24)-sterol reductase n=1 Tax=Aaosphaeria arxii CBS 175.79 TaxID=1450172 RepID=A0A6A5XPV1_9PLEO|nr:24-dehydrocholesterol reductase-like protein precursor [Aaosphaeria arxii CBS 175.79]KAF2014750.1 24-dehydrocholesterol reductase-like protein precursor [Aaosphaeria arxii CBS 175.79]